MFLEPRLDGVDRGVGQRAHGAGYAAHGRGLVHGEFGGVVLGLVGAQERFEVFVGGEVDGLVCALAEGGEAHAAVEGPHAFFPHHHVEGVGGVAVFGDVEWVGHGVVLALKADFHDLHRGDDADGFGYAGEEAR